MKFRAFGIIFMTTVLLSGCTQPEGNIGHWFGSWYLQEILIGGEIDKDYEGYLADDKTLDRLDVLVSFQGNVFNMGYLNGNTIYGTWSYAGETLTLIASYNAGGGYEDSRFNPYPKVLYFPAGEEEMEITVTKLTSRTMQWQYTDQALGKVITYNFKKYP